VATGAGLVGCAAWGKDETDLARCTPSSGLRPPTPESDGSGEHLLTGATKSAGTDWAVDAEGTGEHFVGPIHVRGGVGTVDLGCESVNVAVYTMDDLGNAHAIGVARDRVYRLIFQCTDGALDAVFYDSTDGTRSSYETAMGLCNQDSNSTRDVEFDFPALDLPLPRPIGGFTIDGDGIHLPSGARGSIALDGTDHSMIAFGATDCRKGCASSPWFEVHSLIWDPGGTMATVGVLSFDRPGNPITLISRVQIPGFVANFPETTFEGAFTTP
jgi:hypothetical protein